MFDRGSMVDCSTGVGSFCVPLAPAARPAQHVIRAIRQRGLVRIDLDHGGAAPVLESYQHAAGLLAAIALIGAVAAFRLPETRCRNVYATP